MITSVIIAVRVIQGIHAEITDHAHFLHAFMVDIQQIFALMPTDDTDGVHPHYTDCLTVNETGIAGGADSPYHIQIYVGYCFFKRNQWPFRIEP